jgi:hypothetical protein
MTGRRTQLARILLAIAAVAAAIAAVTDISTVVDADKQHTVVEMWRGYGLVLFAAAFALLAVAPLAFRGLWELVIFHKVALAVTALFLSDAAGTGSIIGWDGGLAVLLIASYVLIRGWRLWAAPDPALSQSALPIGS